MQTTTPAIQKAQTSFHEQHIVKPLVKPLVQPSVNICVGFSYDTYTLLLGMPACRVLHSWLKSGFPDISACTKKRRHCFFQIWILFQACAVKESSCHRHSNVPPNLPGQKSHIPSLPAICSSLFPDYRSSTSASVVQKSWSYTSQSSLKPSSEKKAKNVVNEVHLSCKTTWI